MSLDDRSRQATRLDAIGGRFDPVLLAIALTLAGLGVVMVASSSIAIAEGLDVGPFYFLIRHVVFLGLGCGLASVLMRIELKGWPEPRVIVRFWIISVVLVLVGLATLKVR